MKLVSPWEEERVGLKQQSHSVGVARCYPKFHAPCVHDLAFYEVLKPKHMGNLSAQNLIATMSGFINTYSY